MIRLPLIKGTRVDNNSEWREALPKNMVGFMQEVAGSPGYLRTTDGLRFFSEGVGIDRGGVWSERFNEHYRVSGDRFIKVSQFGEIIPVGDSIPGSNKVQFARSFNSVAFVTNGDYYRWDNATLENVPKPVGAGDFVDMTWIDGYYIFTDGENLWNTNLADETTFGSNQRAGSDLAPDPIIAVDTTTDNKLIVFNRYTTERFYNNAGPQYPFARIPNAAIPIGIVGTDAKARIGDGTWVIFGGSKEYTPSFYLLTNTYQNISTKEIDSIMDQYSDFELNRMSIEFRDTRDQSLVICHLPRNTLVYDLTMSQKSGEHTWYEWTSGDDPWRAINGVYDPRNVDDSASSWIYGDKTDGTIGKLDTTTCTQYGEPLEWSCKTPLVPVRSTVSVMEVQTAPGHNTETDPKIFVSTTKDGVIYSKEAILSQGGPGQYQKRLIMRRLGDYPNLFGLRLRGFSRSNTSLSGCTIE
jgi:hypothetical protein